MEQKEIIESAIAERNRSKFSEAHLTFALTDFNDEGMELLSEMKLDIEGLYLMFSKVTDFGIGYANQFAALKELNICGTSVSTDGLAKLANCTEIQFLELELQSFRADGFEVISRFRNLRQLTIAGDFRNAEIDYQLPLQSNEISKEIQHLRVLDNLESLTLRNVPLQDDDFLWIQGMGKLHSIDLSNSHASSSALKNLAGLPALKNLQLSNTRIDDETLKLLADSLEIQNIGLANTNVRDAAAIYLAKNSPLKSIFAENVCWSRETCSAFFVVPTMENIELNIRGVSRNFLESLQAKRPEIWLHP